MFNKSLERLLHELKAEKSHPVTMQCTVVSVNQQIDSANECCQVSSVPRDLVSGEGSAFNNISHISAIKISREKHQSKSASCNLFWCIV